MRKYAHKPLSQEAIYILEAVRRQAPHYHLPTLQCLPAIDVYVDSSNTATGMIAKIGDRTIFESTLRLPELKDPSSSAKEARGAWAIIAKNFSRIRMEAEALAITEINYLFDNQNLVTTINTLPPHVHTFTQIYAHKIYTLCNTYGKATFLFCPGHAQMADKPSRTHITSHLKTLSRSACLNNHSNNL